MFFFLSFDNSKKSVGTNLGLCKGYQSNLMRCFDEQIMNALISGRDEAANYGLVKTSIVFLFTALDNLLKPKILY